MCIDVYLIAPKIYEYDFALFQTKACDLYSLLALKLKRQILLELKDGCPSHRGDPEKQDKILREYGHYAEAYTLEELEWYGLSEPEARRKLRLILEAANQPVAFKHAFRQKLFEKLKNAESTKAEVVVLEDGKTIIDRQERYLNRLYLNSTIFYHTNLTLSFFNF